jgi:hypothetical protein
MSKPTVSAAGGAIPAGRPTHEPNPTGMSDQIDVIKALADAAYMAAGDLEDFQREAMRSLLDDISSKAGVVQKDFVEFYCGGYVGADGEPVAPPPARPIAAKSAAGDPDLKRELLQIVDEVNEVRYLVDAAWMAAEMLTFEESSAIKSVLSIAKVKLTCARNKLDVARGAPVEDRDDA